MERTYNWTHVATGIKITHEWGTDPVTKQPFLFIEDDAEATFIKVQSSEVCCITIIADARDKNIFMKMYLKIITIGRKSYKLKGFMNRNLDQNWCHSI